MRDIKPCAPKRHSDLASEWDQLAQERHRQINSGEDPSFAYVVVPTALKLLEGADLGLVLDVGSGTGDFTARLAQVATSVIGIEPSAVSVRVARATCSDVANVRFIQAWLEDSGSLLPTDALPTAAVASMTLMTTPDLPGFAKALARLLPREARFVATFCHPCFWPRYWGYETEEWYSYSKEIFIEAPFTISKRQTDVRTTHIHRPLEQYVNVFEDAGFKLECLAEPIPSAEIQSFYTRSWEFPRFLGLRWIRTV
jgi:SAM-dependent methyltransferase